MTRPPDYSVNTELLLSQVTERAIVVRRALLDLLNVLEGITVGRKPQALQDAMDRARTVLDQQP